MPQNRLKKFFKVREKLGNFTLSQGSIISERNRGKVKFQVITKKCILS